MITQVTKGIKISIETVFEGTFFKNYKTNFTFSYKITIENQGKDRVQLTSRYWQVFDSLNSMEIVHGKGVIGKKPIIEPGESYTYKSGSLLLSPIGAMRGYYNMVNLNNAKHFRVFIPTFKLCAPFAIN